MSGRSLPVLDAPAVAALGGATDAVASSATPLDRLGRPLRDLRISVTDRCNFRCVYCMPAEIYGPGHRFLAQDRLLGFDAVERLARAFVAAGARKLRLTGGEPLLRRGLEDLVARLAAIPGVDDLALTTNGSLLADRAADLARAGLRRVTVSLDALDDETHRRVSGSAVPVARVLAGLDAAAAAGLPAVKINTVVRRGLNDEGLVALAERFRWSGATVRFIEYMDVGHTNGWRLDDVVPAAEIVAAIDARFPLEPVAPDYVGEVARRYRYLDGAGEIGVVASVTQPFCGDCTRARLSADGLVYTCLFAARGTDLRPLLDAPSGVLDAAVAAIWAGRTDRYSELRSRATPSPAAPRERVEMSYIGG